MLSPPRLARLHNCWAIELGVFYTCESLITVWHCVPRVPLQQHGDVSKLEGQKSSKQSTSNCLANGAQLYTPVLTAVCMQCTAGTTHHNYIFPSTAADGNGSPCGYHTSMSGARSNLTARTNRLSCRAAVHSNYAQSCVALTAKADSTTHLSQHPILHSLVPSSRQNLWAQQT